MSACSAFERGAAVHPGVQVARAGANLDVEVTDPAHGDVEPRHVALDHAAVEHDRRIGTALVCGDPVDDRVAPDLLLAVTGDAQVDGKLAGRGQQLRCLQEHVQLALVVGHAAGVEPAVALDELERIRVPELERVGRLHVEVPVAEDRGRRLGVLRGADLADDEWALTPGDHLGAAAGSRHEVGDPARPPRRRPPGAPDRR